MASRITIEAINQVRASLLKTKREALDQLKSSIEQAIERIYFKSVPKDLVEIAKKYPGVVREFGWVIWHCQRTTYYFDNSLPDYNSKYTEFGGSVQEFIREFYPKVYVNLEQMVLHYHNSKIEIDTLDKKILSSLKSLSYYSKIKKMYPEAYSIIQELGLDAPKEGSNSLKDTQKDIEEIRHTLGC